MTKNNQLKILFITQYFPPETGAAPERADEFACYLMGRGHDVTVITGFPNHPSGIIHTRYKNKWFYRSKYNNIDVLRTYIYTSPKKNLITRFLNFLSFSISSLFGLIILKKIDIIIVTIPPLFLGITGIIYKYLTLKPLIIDMRDLWPQAAIELGIMNKNFITKIFERMGLFIYKKADKITVVTNGIRDDLIHKKISPNKITLLTNGVNTEIFKKNKYNQNPFEDLGLANKFLVVYAGTMGVAHGATFIVKAATKISSEKEIVFVFIGDGVKKMEIQDEININGLHNIIILPSQPINILVNYLSYSSIGLATLKDKRFCDGIIPVKMFSYMACGLPLILSGYGESRKIIMDSKAGLYIDPENPEQLANAIIQLYRDKDMCKEFGAAGIDYVKTHYSRYEISKRMERIIKKVKYSSN